jgi:uncharacterized membrane protein
VTFAYDRRWAAGAAAASLLFLASWEVVQHVGFWSRGQIVDTPGYQWHGDRVLQGQVPYRDYVIEYPPGALPVFVLPAVGHHEPEHIRAYERAFHFLMVLCGIGCILAMTLVLHGLRASRGHAAAALALMAVSPLLLGSVMVSRYDLWPTLFAVAGLAALVAGRARLGAAAFGYGFAAKFFPVLLAPLGLDWVRRRHGLRAAVSFGLVAVAVAGLVFLPFVIVGADGLRHSFGTQLGRPLQVESLGAALLIAAHHFAGLGLTTVSDHGSQNLEGTLADWIGGISTGVQLCAVLGVWLAFLRGPATRARLVTASAAVLAAFIAFGKVFSPQFMIWLIPFVPLVRGRRGLLATALLAWALVLTQAWFPRHYWQLAANYALRESLLLLLRDLAVAAIVVVLLRDLLQDQGLGEDGAVGEPVEPVGRQVEVGSA